MKNAKTKPRLEEVRFLLCTSRRKRLGHDLDFSSKLFEEAAFLDPLASGGDVILFECLRPRTRSICDGRLYYLDGLRLDDDEDDEEPGSPWERRIGL